MNFYLQRFGIFPAFINEDPVPDLFISVVIPSFNEKELITCLDSLYDCDETKFPAEVIVVINEAENCLPEIKKQNERTFSEAVEWERSHRREKLKFHFIKISLPAKDAGVGLARKAGMDEAVRRLERAGNSDGVIVCFDADCTCEKNYLAEIEKHFLENKKTNAASIYFEHEYEKLEGTQKDAIIHYETFLRYYVNGLRFASHPFAHHTVGSSMAVRNRTYQKQGGMNRRKAGEDFYFLQKIFPLGNFTEINSTCVYPSARSSDRVPFGTGKAVGDHLSGKELLFYDPEIFTELKSFIEEIRKNGFSKPANELAAIFNGRLSSFLHDFNFPRKTEEIKGNIKDEKQFLNRFFNWFDGFMCLKFSHYYSEHFFPRKKITETDFSRINPQLARHTGEELLTQLRRIDRNFGVK